LKIQEETKRSLVGREIKDRGEAKRRIDYQIEKEEQ
jgi:hypothetical protein